MPGMKADSKRESVAWDRRSAIRGAYPAGKSVPLNRILRFALCSLCALCAAKAEARIIDRTLLPLSIVAGGHCDRKPDEVLSAPDAEGGKIDHNFRGFDFVTEGDILPPAIGLGFGLRVKLPGYGPGHKLTIRIKGPSGGPSIWDVKVSDTGYLEVGRLPMPGRALPEGRYVLTILDGPTLLIAYDFAIVGFDPEGLCFPLLS